MKITKASVHQNKVSEVDKMTSIDEIIHRYEDNPIIYSDMPGLEGEKGTNINGPSLVKVPEWVKSPFGKYYLYFAHHGGQYIRLAFADDIKGPWKIYKKGTLHLKRTVCKDHVGSPDVHIDHENHLYRMYFHGPYQDKGQKSFIAFSEDGINFKAKPQVMGDFYFRVFEYDDLYYAFAKNGNKGGVLFRSSDGETSFLKGKEVIPNLRHTAVYTEGDDLFLFYSRMGDCPERILLSYLDLSQDWNKWQPTKPITLLEPEKDYEGADYSLEKSSPGPANQCVRQLRDPAFYEENDNYYLFYSIAGEKGIALAEISKEFKQVAKK